MHHPDIFLEGLSKTKKNLRQKTRANHSTIKFDCSPVGGYYAVRCHSSEQNNPDLVLICVDSGVSLPNPQILIRP
jgi:hypothetical protein